MNIHRRPHTLAALLMLSGVPSMAHAEPFRISIDQGTVNVVVAAATMTVPYEISHAARGQCVPQVAITPEPDGVRIRHTRNCHGSGRDEGTVFTLTLSAAQAYDLHLKAGRINIDGGWGEGGFGTFEGRVSVGGIRSRRPGLDITIERRRLVGAVARYGHADADGGGLTTTVSYGEINLL